MMKEGIKINNEYKGLNRKEEKHVLLEKMSLVTHVSLAHYSISLLLHSVPIFCGVGPHVNRFTRSYSFSIHRFSNLYTNSNSCVRAQTFLRFRPHGNQKKNYALFFRIFIFPARELF